MGAWTYRKPEPSSVRALCARCQEAPQKKRGKDKFRALCTECYKDVYPTIRQTHNKYMRTYEYGGYVKGICCGMCEFIAEDPCQLDVDHIDGNHSNNERSNLQTLCANCHRLKTLRSGEGIHKKTPYN